MVLIIVPLFEIPFEIEELLMLTPKFKLLIIVPLFESPFDSDELLMLIPTPVLVPEPGLMLLLIVPPALIAIDDGGVGV